MCYNCGCRILEDDMGNPANIHTAMLEELSEKWQLDLAEVKKLFLDYTEGKEIGEKQVELEIIFNKAAAAWGQPLEDAKKNTAKILAEA